MKRSASSVRSILWLFSVLLSVSTAFGQVRMEARPLFGEDCAPTEGPGEYVVRIAHSGSQTLRGTLRIESISQALRQGSHIAFSVPFQLAARGEAQVRISSLPSGVRSGDTILRAEDDRGRPLAQLALQVPTSAPSPMVIDATPQTRFAHALRNESPPEPTLSPSTTPTTPSSGLTICSAGRITGTGQAEMPRSLLGYFGVVLVLIDTGSVLNLSTEERSALADFVLSGGALVLLPQRIDELRHPALASFVGPEVTVTDVLPLDPTGNWLAPSPLMSNGSFPATDTFRDARTFRGRHLHHRMLAPMFPWGAPDLLGATADYGFGHVHLLSFNPSVAPALDDPWALGVVSRLARQAIAARNRWKEHWVHSELMPVPQEVRRALDPNQSFRSGLGIAVALLLLYALLAGPLSFRWQQRRGTPLRALALLPVWAVLTFGVLVGQGTLSRGLQGRARRISLVELPAGMQRGLLRRYRGYYIGENATLEVTAVGSDRRLLPDPTLSTGTLVGNLLRDRFTLEDLSLSAWNTAIIREEGLETLPGSVSMQPDPAGALRVTNRTGKTLRDVLVIAQGGLQSWVVGTLRVNESRVLPNNRPVPPATLMLLLNAPTRSRRGAPESTAELGWQVAALFGGDERAAAEYGALLAMLPRDGVPNEPMLLARWDPPSGSTDGGLRIDSDAYFLRVRGWGGEP